MPRNLIPPPRRVKITDATGVWFATAHLAPEHLTGDKLCRWLTKQAILRGVRAIYEPATEQEYQDYKKNPRDQINVFQNMESK